MTGSNKRRRAKATVAGAPSVCTWNEEESLSASSSSKHRQASIRSFCFQTARKKPFLGTPPTPAAISPSSVKTPPSPQLSQSKDHHKTPPPPPIERIQPQKKKLAQVFLDCGQRNWGQVLCPKCNMLYVPGVQEDTKEHEKVCSEISLGVKWRGTAGKLIQRVPNNNNNNDGIHLILPSFKKKETTNQATCVFSIVANDLGMDGNTILQQQKQQSCLLYLRNQRVVGVALVEPISKGYRMNNLYEREQSASKALLGVAVLWTHPTVRQQGIATRLVDAARSHVIFGMKVPRMKIAFSSPTQAGWTFAKQYCCLGETTTATTPLVYEYHRPSNASS